MRLILILAFALMTACSSNMKKGDNMMEAEQYDQAVIYYERALIDDPGDEEIAQKLYEARTRMVYAHLIKVRLQRQGQQQRAAALLLNETLKNIKKWKIIADSGVKATIEEEVMEAGLWLNQELNELGKQRAYNPFYYHLAAFDEIYASGLADQSVKRHLESMKSLGQSQCSAMKSQLTPQSHFLHDAWLAYCGVFGVQGRYALKGDTTRYSALKISANGVKVSRGTDVNKRAIAKNIQNQLNGHLWFSSKGSKSLKLALTGAITYSKSVKSKTFTRIYKDKEETFEIVKDPKNPKKTLRKLVKSKPVKKSVKFKGKQITEKTSHSLELLGRISGQPLSVSERTATKTHETQSHSTYFKSEGIRPLNPKYLDQTAWMRSMGKRIIDQAKIKLDKQWKDTFCRATKINKNLAQDEYPARCAQLDPSHPSVNAWAQSQFDLSYEQLTTLLNK